MRIVCAYAHRGNLARIYNTGARIQEALDLSPSAIRFTAPATSGLSAMAKSTIEKKARVVVTIEYAIEH